jgi:hypothetical protein
VGESNDIAGGNCKFRYHKMIPGRPGLLSKQLPSPPIGIYPFRLNRQCRVEHHHIVGMMRQLRRPNPSLELLLPNFYKAANVVLV